MTRFYPWRWNICYDKNKSHFAQTLDNMGKLRYTTAGFIKQIAFAYLATL